MKILKKKTLKSTNGITLIALVITIIVLLILAGISISMLSGDNGILQKATEAKTRTERQSIIEQARTDVLGYQAENKGGDLEKTQLKAVLDSYFKDVPEVEELPDGEDLLKRKFTTLDKYGTHTIEVSEIYNGNISGSSKVKATSLFEDKAGDEEGATKGKIHIGDYVNYNPIAEGDTGTESKYKYQSSNDYTGVTDAISSNKLTGFSDSSQNFLVKSNLKWQIIGINGDNILITSETPIIPDNPVSVREETGYGLYGAKAYVNVSGKSGERNEINNIAQIYGNGKGADSSKSRGMTIEDINKVTGVTVNETSIIPEGVDMFGWYGSAYNFEAGSFKGWSPEAWINKEGTAISPGISGNVTGYAYQSSNTSLKTSNSAIRNKVIFGENSKFKSYWLASSGIGGHPTAKKEYGPGYVYNRIAWSYKNTFESDGLENVYTHGVCPVIYLDSDVSLTSAGTTGSVTTWNIN